jgi:hypothetical protein
MSDFPYPAHSAALENVQANYACELRQGSLIPRKGIVLDVSTRHHSEIDSNYSWYDVTARFYVSNAYNTADLPETEMQNLRRRVRELEDIVIEHVDETC